MAGWPRVGPTPIGDGAIVTFRVDRRLRWAAWASGPAAMVGVFTLTGWGHASVVLPLAVALGAVLSISLGAVATRSAVTLTAGALIVRGLWRQQTEPWADITAIHCEWGRVWVTTVTGTTLLPLSDTAHDEAGSVSLGPAVGSWWVGCRGDDWSWHPLDPWQPTVDRRGRVVLRRGLVVSPPLFRWVLLSLALGVASDGSTTTIKLVDAAVMVGLGVAGWLAHNTLAAVFVDRDDIVVRSLTSPRGQHLPRSMILEVREVSAGAPLRGAKPRLVELVTTRGPVRLPAPVCGMAEWDSDPEFYRKLIWLHHELTPLPPPPFPAGEDDRGQMR